MGFNSADYLHVHVEAKKLAFADRAKFYADPEFGGPTAELIAGLISKSLSGSDCIGVPLMISDCLAH